MPLFSEINFKKQRTILLLNYLDTTSNFYNEFVYKTTVPTVPDNPNQNSL